MPKSTPPAPAGREPLVDRFSVWKARGPLYSYRKESKLTMGAVASTLRVSIGTVQNLEDGNRDPRDKAYWPALCKLIAPGHGPGLAVVWGAWLDRKPRA